ncbi:MAG: tetratricopeptide repeat protein [Deltaproteobacteria bacterium]|nr:tetratricopeptide repeat protein [Deltaproteobacteria bacterium]
MNQEHLERRLAAIFSADVKGYSRLMGDDEAATVQTIKEYRQVLGDLIQKHRGRVVDSPGDNLLAEFGSVVEAVECAVEVQKEIKKRNAGLPQKRKMEFRIGVNLGDVIVDGQQIFGDGVNIAARLEGLAESGGVCIAGNVYDQVQSKLDLNYTFLGKKRVRNIARPIRAYQIVIDREAPAKDRRPEPSPEPGKKHKALWTTVIVVAVLLIGTGLGWQLSRHRPTPPSPPPATVPQAAAPQMPDKPSIAVLPFVNMSGEEEQEYFSDGMTEDIITDLSKVSGLYVISRNSVFTYKGQAVRVEQVSRELGVRYVLEGSVRKAGDRVRITAQLIEGTTGRHLWAERYDRELKDIFDLQDEVTEKIVTALKVRLTQGEKERVETEETKNTKAYELVLQARNICRVYTPESNDKGRELFKKALEIDPGYALAHAGLGWCHFAEWSLGWTNDRMVLQLAAHEARLALSLDETLSEAHILMGWVYLWRKQHDQAIAALEKAIDLNPNDAQAFANLAEVLVWAGQPQEAVKLVRKAMRLDPRNSLEYSGIMGKALLFTDQVNEAVKLLQEVIEVQPTNLPVMFSLAGAFARAGRLEEARSTMKRILEAAPGYSLEMARQRLPFKDPDTLEDVLDVFRQAGLK